MAKQQNLPAAERFNLSSFADVLPRRDPIIGEDANSFADFHDALLRSLDPVTAYECVVAENLIAIEWELLQHRRMRDAALRGLVHDAVVRAYVARRRSEHEGAMDEAYDAHIEAGGSEDDFEEPEDFDDEAAMADGSDLAGRATSPDEEIQAAACEEIETLGLDVVSLMSEAYTGSRFLPSDTEMTAQDKITKHDAKEQELERRRREVKRDYDALQSARPVEVEAIEE